MYKAHHWALYHMWFQNKSELYDLSISNTIHMYSGITSGRVLDGELLYTKILEVNVFAFAYRLFHEDFSPIDETLSAVYIFIRHILVFYVGNLFLFIAVFLLINCWFLFKLYWFYNCVCCWSIFLCCTWYFAFSPCWRSMLAPRTQSSGGKQTAAVPEECSP